MYANLFLFVIPDGFEPSTHSLEGYAPYLFYTFAFLEILGLMPVNQYLLAKLFWFTLFSFVPLWGTCLNQCLNQDSGLKY